MEKYPITAYAQAVFSHPSRTHLAGFTVGNLPAVGHGAGVWAESARARTRASLRAPHHSGCLASEKVLSVAQDPTGYLWIGTHEGLHRFDGYELKCYQHDPRDSTSRSNNVCEAIYVDRKGTLWAWILTA
ncbi:MAG: hypothetical protein D6722_18185 [Bacteroidetes bacterium]|nr:MAG: hypothetical protein D6722_18185 [Bacteroidota bacterium]